MALFAILVLMALCGGLLAGRAGSKLLGGAVPRWWCETGCAVAFAPLPACGPAAFAAAAAAWWLCCLAVSDLAVRRLPNMLTASGAAAIVSSAFVLGRGSPACVGALCFSGAYFVIHLVSPASMGAGDVKLAFGLGALCAAVRPPAVLLVALLSSLFSALAAVIVLMRRQRSPPSTVAHGASMCLAAYVVLVPAVV
ncbi:peptidase A24A prepilin type IV [Segniliparus rotundus DSM 44985]|uniref:Peptidase A24A prepilin type IV n=1 Tax=Segniliparus rotundus (strain ATCC BAA-972 / CDC 1076 / CIP 108378 / DSM 44985 / JCM 13578) TaxID=640132 RepID=D6Z8V3_SEGRD|nr:prepilin peptidase [Segniliparus rotundus]ADG98383.1 peptidase A24A prepilin type IV [Segniliparus rotundus DSM 44985]